MDIDKIEMMFKLMEYNYLSDSHHKLIVDYETFYNRTGFLTEPQFYALEDIFNKAAESVEWSR